ncbi:hypothetical protein CEXT_759021 [Caerostris extrusa]|uniref:Uncharacterized protein n=1 Tax=Caerostris extrusa TaxID=172846 RepID=A0AAV4NND5_CAEEX|nr:hypothetical protein CEXT_759021 [Caerostris extrusa]
MQTSKLNQKDFLCDLGYKVLRLILFCCWGASSDPEKQVQGASSDPEKQSSSAAGEVQGASSDPEKQSSSAAGEVQGASSDPEKQSSSAAGEVQGASSVPENNPLLLLEKYKVLRRFLKHNPLLLLEKYKVLRRFLKHNPLLLLEKYKVLRLILKNNPLLLLEKYKVLRRFLKHSPLLLLEKYKGASSVPEAQSSSAAREVQGASSVPEAQSSSAAREVQGASSVPEAQSSFSAREVQGASEVKGASSVPEAQSSSAAREVQGASYDPEAQSSDSKGVSSNVKKSTGIDISASIEIRSVTNITFQLITVEYREVIVKVFREIAHKDNYDYKKSFRQMAEVLGTLQTNMSNLHGRICRLIRAVLEVGLHSERCHEDKLTIIRSALSAMKNLRYGQEHIDAGCKELNEFIESCEATESRDGFAPEGKERCYIRTAYDISMSAIVNVRGFFAIAFGDAKDITEACERYFAEFQDQ